MSERDRATSKIRNNPSEYITVGMIQSKRREEWLSYLAQLRADLNKGASDA